MVNEQLDEKAIFNTARHFNTQEARQEYLDQVCGTDTSLRERIVNLMKGYEEQESFLESLPIDRLSTFLDQSIIERPGGRIGPYKLREQIGEGGFGVVFVAEQLTTVRRKVALKVIKPGMDSSQVLARFEAERQALALMDHPNVARVLDAGTSDAGRPYFAMELIHGVSITEFCDSQKLPMVERLRLFIDVCMAVQHAHQKGIIHRDIKPSNVMVTLHDHRPVVKVIDFGVAKALGGALTEKTIYTAYGQMVGTPMYMSPEQAQLNGIDVDTRSDVYSLGVLAYELLTGSPPYDKEKLERAGLAEMRRMILEVEPHRPSIQVSTLNAQRLTTICDNRGIDANHFRYSLRGELDWIVMKTLEKDRTRRYETASGLAEDVKRYLEGEPVSACPPSTAYRIGKFVERNRAAVFISGAMLFLLIAGITATTWQAVKAIEQSHRAIAAESLAQQRLEESEDARLDALAAKKKAEDAYQVADDARQKAEVARKEAEVARQEAEVACAAYLKQLRELAETGAISQAECSKQLRAFPLQHANLLMLETHDPLSPLYKASPFRDKNWVAKLPLDQIEQARSEIGQAFEDNPQVMQWIVMFGWAQEIREHIIEKVKADGAAVDQHYFQLAVDLAEPELYPILQKATVAYYAPLNRIELLRSLPNFDLKKTIQMCWQKPEVTDPGKEMAIAIAKLGEPSALNYLIGMLKISPDDYRDDVLGLIGFLGTNQEIVSWHKSNHEKLIFNSVSGKFILPGDQALTINHDDKIRTRILERWKNVKDTLAKDVDDAALAAAKIGDVSALQHLINRLKVPVVHQMTVNEDGVVYELYTNHHRNAVLRTVDFRGSNKEIVDWYNANKDKITFNSSDQKFYLPK